jgi:hypothetical protein
VVVRGREPVLKCPIAAESTQPDPAIHNPSKLDELVPRPAKSQKLFEHLPREVSREKRAEKRSA